LSETAAGKSGPDCDVTAPKKEKKKSAQKDLDPQKCMRRDSRKAVQEDPPLSPLALFLLRVRPGMCVCMQTRVSIESECACEFASMDVYGGVRRARLRLRLLLLLD
jgi:hypothetical protein